MEVPVSSCRGIHLSLGNRISVFYLERQNTKDLADLHLCDARRNRVHDGDVSLRSHHDHYQCSSVRLGFRPLPARENQPAAAGSCPVNRAGGPCPPSPRIFLESHDSDLLSTRRTVL